MFSITTFIFMDFPARFDTGYPVLTLSKPQSSMVPLPSPGDPSVRQRTACCIGAPSMRHSATRPLGRRHGSGATMLSAPPMVTLGHQTLDLGWENMMIYNRYHWRFEWKHHQMREFPIAMFDYRRVA